MDFDQIIFQLRNFECSLFDVKDGDGSIFDRVSLFCSRLDKISIEGKTLVETMNDNNELKVHHLNISLDEFQIHAKKIFTNFYEIIHKNVSSLESSKIESILTLFINLADFDIFIDSQTNIELLELIRNIIQTRNVALAQCFKLLGHICCDNKLAQSGIIKSNLLNIFIDKFKEYLKTDFTEIEKQHESNIALTALHSMSAKNDDLLVILIKNDIHIIIFQYICVNYNNDQDILFPGCVNLLLQLMYLDRGEKLIACNFIEKTAEMMIKCDIDENWDAIFNALETLIAKFSVFAVSCIKHGFFDTILDHLTQFTTLGTPPRTIPLLLNILVLVSYPLDSCLWLLEQKMDDLLNRLFPTSGPIFQASFSLIIGNFCYNDQMAVKFVEEKKFHESISNVLIEILKSDSPNETYLISYLSILKNLSVPMRTRGLISTYPPFRESVRICSKISHAIVLQKLYILLRMLIRNSDPSFSQYIIDTSDIYNALIFHATHPDGYNLCRSAATLILMIFIADHFDQIPNPSTIINEQLLINMSENVSPQFLIALFGDVRANTKLFSHFSDEHVKILWERKYFQKLYDLTVIQPYKPLLVVNALPAFLVLAKTGDLEKGHVFLDDCLAEAVASLNDFPDVIEPSISNEIISKFNVARKSR